MEGSPTPLVPHLSTVVYFVYLLKSKKNGSLYIGITNDFQRRLDEHNSGKNISTRRYMPWVLIYFEGYLSKFDAEKRELNLKHFAKAYGQLKGRISNSLQDG